MRPARRLELAAHSARRCAQLAEERVAFELSPERRRLAVARVDDGVGAVALGADGRSTRAASPQSPPARSVAADGAGEQEVAGEDACRRRRTRHDRTSAPARGDLERRGRRPPPGRPRSPRARARGEPPGSPAARLAAAQRLELSGRRPHLGARSPAASSATPATWSTSVWVTRIAGRVTSRRSSSRTERRRVAARDRRRPPRGRPRRRGSGSSSTRTAG